MPNIDLGDVQKEITSAGFAVREGTLNDVSYSSARTQTWTVAKQKNGAAVSVLRPMAAAHAPPRTLSAIHGLGAQPLHTDGAHLERMPDVIVLYASDPNATPTLIWRLAADFPSSLHSGVFTVRGNQKTFLAHAYDYSRLRFDPVCMTPADHLAEEASAFLEDSRADASKHHWDQGETLLFIDNRTTLHAREALANAADEKSRVLERAAYYLESR